MKNALLLATLWATAASSAAAQGLATSADGAASPSISDDSRLFELRTYTAAPGKLEALNARFRDHTNRLFVKHGMTVVAYWVPLERPNTLIYLLAYEDRAARDRAWQAFAADPEWVAARTESVKDGPLTVQGGVVSMFVKATDYSPMK